ncbi:2903_t:CDS:2 [Acaulospora morrowiae]|uniref:2903_t:CDS:1 n=1 Tax=Acaulospora morrowiae TaxID=94023 RepID=A0A9N9CNZ2_9GLOM|nr:2903_t:CDS:2 [Acaulospora morrowiae]
MSTTQLRLRKELLNLARERLLAVQQEENMEASENMEPIVIAENVSLEAYINFCKTEQKLPVRIRLVDGKVIAYEVPLSNHGMVAGEIAFLIHSWNNQLRHVQEEDLVVSQNSYLTADVTIRPLDLPPSPADQEPNSDEGAYPTMVVESFDILFFSTNDYSNLPYNQTAFHSSRRYNALRYLCTNQNQMVPDVVKSFGTAPLHRNTIDFLLNDVGVKITGVGFTATTCNAPSIPNYQLHIPTVELFHGSPSGVPAGAINGFYLTYGNYKI